MPTGTTEIKPRLTALKAGRMGLFWCTEGLKIFGILLIGNIGGQASPLDGLHHALARFFVHESSGGQVYDYGDLAHTLLYLGS